MSRIIRNNMALSKDITAPLKRNAFPAIAPRPWSRCAKSQSPLANITIGSARIKASRVAISLRAWPFPPYPACPRCLMWSMPMRLISAAYQTTGNLARTQWIANTQQILVVALSAAVLSLGGGLLSIAFIQVFTVSLISALVLLDLKHRRSVLFPGFSAARLSALTELAHPSLLFALLLIGNLVVMIVVGLIKQMMGSKQS